MMNKKNILMLLGILIPLHFLGAQSYFFFTANPVGEEEPEIPGTVLFSCDFESDVCGFKTDWISGSDSPRTTFNNGAVPGDDWGTYWALCQSLGNERYYERGVDASAYDTLLVCFDFSYDANVDNGWGIGVVLSSDGGSSFGSITVLSVADYPALETHSACVTYSSGLDTDNVVQLRYYTNSSNKDIIIDNVQFIGRTQ